MRKLRYIENLKTDQEKNAEDDTKPEKPGGTEFAVTGCRWVKEILILGKEEILILGEEEILILGKRNIDTG